jgi:DNA-binding transcriptional ArsR family regulator
MPGDANVAQVASLLADPTRVRVLMALLDGRALPASDLARSARVSPSTVSHHLRQLLEHQLLLVEPQGRHRYFRLANPAIAQAVEELAALAPAAPVRTLSESEVGRALRAARMCYNHFAGRFGVALAQRLVEKELLCTVSGGYLVTSDGEQWLQEMGIACAPLGRRGQIFAPHHVDWSERRHHIAGALGAALAHSFCESGWVKRMPTSRAVHLTEQGTHALCSELGLRLVDGNELVSS